MDRRGATRGPTSRCRRWWPRPSPAPPTAAASGCPPGCSLANALAAVLRGRWLVVAIPVVAAASMWAAWAVTPHDASRMWTEGFVVLLAGVANAAFTALLDTVAELRRTRAELARVAVAEERERFSRDLHDLLGHTLSVMVVKAQAVRRLAAQDPDAAAAHAADIEQIGRQALVDVRQAVDAMRAPTLAEELDGARRALDAAGIVTTVEESVAPPSDADEVLAWVVREGATNVLRHSGASACRIALTDLGGRIALTIADDGVGGPTAPALPDRWTGRSARPCGVGGRGARRGAGDEGFRLVATLPEAARDPRVAGGGPGDDARGPRRPPRPRGRPRGGGAGLRRGRDRADGRGSPARRGTARHRAPPRVGSRARLPCSPRRCLRAAW